MEDQVYEFGKIQVVVTAEFVACSVAIPAWISRFFSQSIDPDQLRGFIEDGRFVNRVELHQLDNARVVETRRGGAGYLDVLLANRKTPGRVGRLVFPPFLLMTEGVVKLRGKEQVQRAHEAAAAINAIAMAYQGRYRKNVMELFHVYDTDARYTWKIIPSAANATFRIASYLFYLCVLIPGITYLILVLLELISTGLAFWTAVVFAVLAVTTLVDPGMIQAMSSDTMAKRQFHIHNPDGQASREAVRVYKISGHLMFVATFTAAGIASFALIGFLIGSPRFWFAEGFQPAPVTRLEWSLFMAESFLDTLSLDIFGTLGFDLSKVQATTRWASASVVALKVSMASGIVAAIYRAVKTGQNTHSFVGTPSELVTEVFTNTNFLSIGQVVLDGKVTALARPLVFDTKTTVSTDPWEAP